MELLDPQDIVDPILLLQKISMGINRKPVSVSLPVSEPYFIFSAPRVADTAPRVTDTAPRVTDTTPRVTDTAPRVTDNYTGMYRIHM